MKNLLLITLLLVTVHSKSQISLLQPQMNITVTQGAEVRTYGEPLPGVHGHFINADLGEISPAKPTLFMGARLIINEPMNQNIFLVKYYTKPTAGFNWMEFTVSRTGNDQNILYYTGPFIDLAEYGEAGLNQIQVYWTISMHHTTTGQITSYTFDNNGANFLATYTVVALIPVTLMDFKVTSMNNLIRLNWRTALEINFKEFRVERSTDGVNFTTIGTITGIGSSSINAYEFADEEHPSGTLYYRLKLIDDDGKYSYSQTKSVEAMVTFKVVPNPVQSTLVLLEYKAGAFIEIIDFTGKIWVTKKISYNSIDVSALAPGKYILKLAFGKDIKIGNFIKL